MGEAKRKEEARQIRAAFYQTLPSRIGKGAFAFIVAIPFMLIFIAWDCFEKNRWPWECEQSPKS